MLGFNVPQCLSLLFILFILNTSAELGVHVFALDNLNKRCFVPGGLFFFFSTLTDLENNHKRNSEYDMKCTFVADFQKKLAF